MRGTICGLLLLTSLAVISAKAQVSCSPSITSCGCTITQAGVYTVNANLSAAQGLTPLIGCIDINTERVKLFLNGHSISGAGAGTGIGVHLLAAGKYAFIEGNVSAVSGWEFGIESEADNVIIDLPVTDHNTTGSLLKGTHNDRVSGRDSGNSSNNSVYGIWVVGGNGNHINSAGAFSNGIAAIYVGCSATGPTGTPCATGQASTSNLIYNNSLNAGPRQFGVVLEAGSIRNTVMNNIVGSNNNSRFDLFDGNTICDKNVWRVNAFKTANQACIH